MLLFFLAHELTLNTASQASTMELDKCQRWKNTIRSTLSGTSRAFAAQLTETVPCPPWPTFFLLVYSTSVILHWRHVDCMSLVCST